MEIKTFTETEEVPSAMTDYVKDTMTALEEINSTAKSMNDAVETMIKSLKEKKELPTKLGMSFLELRNLLLLTYETNLASVVGTKVEGKSLEGNRAILRLVETRTAIEKMKPIYFKLKYRIEKLIRAASMKGNMNPNDPLNLKPNPDAFDIDMNEEDETSEEKSSSKKDKKYVPPKVSAVHFEENLEDKKQKQLEKAKKRALNSSLIQELRNEFDDTPEEICEISVGRRRVHRQEIERTKYEEEYLTRLPQPKKSVAHKRRVEDGFLTINQLGSDLTRFDNVSALDEDGDAESMFKRNKSAPKKRKLGAKAMKRKAKTAQKFKRKK